MNGIFILALDVSWFLPRDEFRAKVDQLTAYIKSAKPVPGGDGVRIPGERSRAHETRRLATGITLDEKTCAQLLKVLTDLGLPADLPYR
jgi:LDH2 family malate/lactate/ureidoglycolate dehydrogenase